LKVFLANAIWTRSDGICSKILYHQTYSTPPANSTNLMRRRLINDITGRLISIIIGKIISNFKCPKFLGLDLNSCIFPILQILARNLEFEGSYFTTSLYFIICYTIKQTV